MSFCIYCGSQSEDNNNFCQHCGKPVKNIQNNFTSAISSQSTYTAEEKKFLDDFAGFLKWERFGYKIIGILYAISSIFAAAIAVIYYFIMSTASYSFGLFITVWYFLLAIGFFPIVIINFSLKNKTQRYIDSVYTDIKSVELRCGNVGMIIVSVLFCQLAAVFVIINFTRTKTNKNLIDSISYKQKSEGSNA